MTACTGCVGLHLCVSHQAVVQTPSKQATLDFAAWTTQLYLLAQQE